MAVVILWFLAGWAARRVVPRSDDVGRLLDRWVLDVALPALILVKLPALAIDASVAVPAAVAWGGVVVGAAVVLGAARLRSWDRRTTGALLLVTPLGNTSFMGLAVVEALLGRDHLGPALAFDQLGSFLALSCYGSVVAAHFGVGPAGWRPVVRRLSRFAPFVALLVSLPLRAIDLPGPAHDVLTALGRTVAPLAMLALGLRFRVVVRRRLAGPAAVCLATKLVVLPLLALFVASAVAAPDGLAWSTSVLEAGMPPMVTAGLVAIRAGLDEELTTFVVGVGTLLALGTLPVLHAML
ncbi:MAG: Auxin Efflux Carrier [Actinomycetia bacterium]|nr:Auxin Efflux Carrier [Actinomycetes bacterium]